MNDYMKKGYISDIIFDLADKVNLRQYPYNLPALKEMARLPLDDRVTFIVGENGSGKSTLIEAIALAYGFNAEGGSINFSFSTRNSSSDLYQHIKLNRTARHPRDGFFLRAESFYNVATNIEAMDALPAASKKIIASYGGRSLHEQSHGESFLALFLNRFGGKGLYILDEPEAALSSERQLAFMARLHELVHCDSQFIIATHSPIIMSYPQATIYQIGEHGMKKTDYEETEQYQFMKAYINNYKKFLHELLK
ncbi:MAG: AAA family ATPase [Clostridiaceae bacterium]|nr:AAA family ATPase [Clostridiaceae bacterium]